MSVLQAVAQLIEMGTPPAILAVVLPLYVRHMQALEADLVVALSERAGLGPELPGTRWPPTTPGRPSRPRPSSTGGTSSSTTSTTG